MTSKLDSLISEIAASLNITEAEVTSTFTQQELEQVLSDVSCVPDGQVPLLADEVDAKCNDIGPVIEPSDDVVEINLDPQLGDKQKCLDTTSDVSKIIQQRVEEYNSITQLISRLIEYRDNFNVISEYYSERSKECARLLNLFEPLLIQKNELAQKIQSNTVKITNLNSLKAQTTNAQTLAQYDSQIATLNAEISKNREDLQSTELLLTQRTDQVPIFSNKDLIGKLANVSSDEAGSLALATAVTDYLTSIDFNAIKNQVESYSECVKVDNLTVLSYSSFIKSPTLEFKLKFINLDGLKTTVQKTNQETGETYDEDAFIPFENNPFLIKKSFFEEVNGLKISNNQVNSEYVASGSIYTDYYNLFSDPINNFFSLEERGLTSSESLVDPTLRDSQSQTKIENGKEYYIRNQQTLQDFYKDFETRFEERKNQVRSQKIDPKLASIKLTLATLASREIQLLLALGKVNTAIKSESDPLRTIVDSVNGLNSKVLQKKSDLNQEIDRLIARADEIKPEPAKVKRLLQESNPECFGSPETADIEPLGCADALKFAGTDPYFEKIGEASNVAYPHPGQLCYWLEFSKIATLMGLLPLPQSPSSLRYWPVGLTIPTPATLIKVPLPIIWVPLFVLPTPMGQFVLFLTINGIFISPMVFLNSSSGKKKFILTLRGASKDIGLPLDSSNIFSKLLAIPLGAKAAAEQAKITARIAKDGKHYHLTESEKKDYEVKKKTIENNLAEASASGDPGKILKLTSDLAKLEESYLPKNEYLEAIKIIDHKESSADLIEKAKRNLFKSMNDLGNPAIPSLDKLKAESLAKKQELSDKKYAALEQGNIEEYNKLNAELKSYDIPYERKLEAFTKDILDYFDRVKIPSVKFPQDASKIEPKPNAILSLKNQVEDLIKNNSTGKLHAKQLNIKSKLVLHLIKAKDEILSIAPAQSFNLETNPQQFKDFLKTCVDKMIDSAAGIGGGLPSEEDVANELALEEQVANTQDPTEKNELKKKLIETKKKNSRLLDKAKDAEEFIKGSSFISSIASNLISFSPFDVGAIPKTPSFDSQGIPPVLNIAKTTLHSAIDAIPTDQLLKLTGGVKVISPSDVITSCFNLISDKLPNTQIPQIQLNIPAVTTAVSAPLALTSEIKAPIPALAAMSVPAQVPINLEILKQPIKEAISAALKKIPQDSELNPLTNIDTINSNDLKSFLTKTIDEKILSFEPLISNLTKPLEFAKSGNGVSLNVIEAAQFKVAPYGPAEEILFNAKALIKANLAKSLTIPYVDPELLKTLVAKTKPVLEPLTTPPLSYLIAATAGLTQTTDAIRELHPILQNDDLPPWERLSSRNILFLLFLDDFIKNAADKTGFFRNFL